jgi:hypothetical protein
MFRVLVRHIENQPFSLFLPFLSRAEIYKGAMSKVAVQPKSDLLVERQVLSSSV